MAVIFLLFLILTTHMNFIQNEPISLSKNLRLIPGAFEVEFDPYYLEYFRKVSPDTDVYEFFIKRDVFSFYVDTFVRSNTKDKEVYRMTNMDGCLFLSNPLINRLFYKFYKNLLVNKTLFSCPVKSSVYLLHTLLTKDVMPVLHSKGNFTSHVRIRNNTANNDSGIMLNFRWTYRFTKMK